ncbi:MAG: aspartate/glutamate racemase family protein [Pseudomonadota bacterium]
MSGSDTASHVAGGRSVYGASVGILMLEARFPRIVGDMGNALTWPFPVQYRVVQGASPDRVVRGGASGLLDPFIDAARDLIAHGADGITTNCGFLAIYQEELAAALDRPVATSSLMQVNLVNATLPPGKRAGILTISASSLTPRHLEGARVPASTPIATTEGRREFSRAILDNEYTLNVEAAREDNVEAALELQSDHPDVGAIVLECTNMIPYAADIQQATGLPTYSMASFVSWFQSALQPLRYRDATS